MKSCRNCKYLSLLLEFPINNEPCNSCIDSNKWENKHATNAVAPVVCCKDCKHLTDCNVRKALKSARETIFNLSREKTGRNDYIFDGKLIPADKTEGGEE